jgi:endonuclease/exonuclease/phosphatase family metal-dependent hydrolase
MGVLLYLPPLFGPTLLTLLGGFCLAWKGFRRCGVVMMLTALALAGPGLRFRTHDLPVPTVDALRLRVLTCNRGQNNGHTTSAFIKQCQPDLIAIQDAFVPGAYDSRAWPLPYSAPSGAFLLMSRYPIHSTEVFMSEVDRYDRKLRIKTQVQSMRHVVKLPGQDIAIYNLHLPSPRFALTGSSMGGTVSEDHWQEQRKLVQEALQRMESDPLPVIALGDWNVPARGPLYRQMTRRLLDVHAEVAAGYGFTAPGDMRGWWSLWQSWLRLDYVLVSRDWQPLRCKTEPFSQAQHSAVFAELRLR